MMKNVSVRLNKEILKEAEVLAKIEKVDTSVIIREALEKGFAEIKLKTALRLFTKGKISTSEAAKIADLSIGEMMDEIVKSGLKQDFLKENIKSDFKKALKVIN